MNKRPLKKRNSMWNYGKLYHLPKFHITAAVQKMVILYMIETALKKAENSLDRDVQKEIMENGM